MPVDNSRLLLVLMYEKHLNSVNLTTTEASEKLEISKSAITDICKKLRLSNYIYYEPYKPFEFTNSGLLFAKHVFYRLSIIEKYLFTQFKLSPYRAKKEAINIEPAVSDFLIEKIRLKTPVPEISLFGLFLNDFPTNTYCLSSCASDNIVIPVAISQGIGFNDGEFWAEIAFLFGKHIYIKSINNAIDAITVIVENSTRNISLKIAEKIIVIKDVQSNSQN